MPPWDPLVTVALLVFGLVNVTQTVAQARDLGPVLDAFFAQQGLDGYTNARAASVAGVLIAVSTVLCLVIAIAVAVPRLRQHRRAAWIPIICAVVSVVVTSVIVGGAVMSDPAFLAYLQARS